VRRREFIAGLGTAVTWPAVARAQQPMMPVIGWLDNGGQAANPITLAAFQEGLKEVGFIEGRNVTIEFHVTEGNDQLSALANALVRRQVNVIYATGNSNCAQAAKAATTTIPIVFYNGSNPVSVGLVVSLNRPGGNVTGVTNYAGDLVPKRLQLLREIVPRATTIGYLRNPTNLISAGNLSELLAAARSVGQQIVVWTASTADEIDAAFATATQQRVGAILVTGDAFFYTRRNQLSDLAARYAIPASYDSREYAEAGGLMSYGDDRMETLRRAGVYVGRVLKGEKPADLPIQQPTRFQFVLNVKTAKALGIDVQPKLLALADEVIE
jgi:putative tryptophan/tyrosine transport system substrate-binding protein